MEGSLEFRKSKTVTERGSEKITKQYDMRDYSEDNHVVSISDIDCVWKWGLIAVQRESSLQAVICERHQNPTSEYQHKYISFDPKHGLPAKILVSNEPFVESWAGLSPKSRNRRYDQTDNSMSA